MDNQTRLPAAEPVRFLPLKQDFENRKPCTATGCDRLRLARGLCNMHYYRARRDLKRRQRELAAGNMS